MRKAITVLVISLLSCISIHTPFARTIKGKGFDKDSIPYSKDEQRGITTMDLLMKYKWKMSRYRTDTYTEKHIHTEIEINSDSSIEGKTLYYLSQKKRIRKFDKKQIGVHKNGKYMILNTVGFPAVHEILEINDTSLITRETRFGTIAKYKAMPK